MSAPLFSAADYLGALQALLPRGRAWPRDPDATLSALLEGFAGRFADSNADANTLLVEAFPATAGQMLQEWEDSLGLPGVYGVTPGTTQGRQAAVVAALTDTGGQSATYFITLAGRLGYTITITQFRAYNVGMSVVAPIYHDDWAHTWQVNAAAAIAITYTPTADVVQATPNFGNPLLEAVLALYKPAHSVVITSYT